MKQSPGLGLRIMLFKMRQKLGVGEVLQTRRVVCHDVLLSWEEMGQVAIAVCPLVVAGEAAEGGCGSVTGHCPLAHSRHRWGVVREGFDGGVLEGEEFAHDVDLTEEGGVFQVAVGDLSVGVMCGG